MHGEAETVGYGKSTGRSVSETEGETFVTDYALLPTTMYSLTEQQHRIVGELMNLGLRECFVKVGNQRPLRTRTVDLEPAFRSDYFRRVWMPIYRAKSLAHSLFLLPCAQVDQELAARTAPVAAPQKQEPDFTKPEPLAMLIDNPAAFAQNFHAKNPKPSGDPPKLKPKPKKTRPGRKPVGELPPAADRFTVIDGDKGPNVDK